MAQPQGIIGDEFGTDLPQTEMPQIDLDEELRLAKFSKTKEFKRLKEYIDIRKDYYKTFQPHGEPMSKAPTGKFELMWLVSNTIIAEFDALVQAYENADEVIKEAKKQLNARRQDDQTV